MALALNKKFSFFKIQTPNIIDFSLIIRGLAATGVIWYHTAGFFPGKSFSKIFLNSFCVSGRFAVWIFFILSGYVIASGFLDKKYLFDRQSLLIFFRNRILRIYPLFLFCSLLSFFIFRLHLESKPITWSFFLKNFLMLQWNHVYPLNGVYWTLGVEMQFYLLAPLIIWFHTKKFFTFFRSILFYIFLLLVPTFFFFLKNNHWDNMSLAGNFYLFEVGILARLFKDQIFYLSKKFKQSTLMLLLLVTVLVFCFSNLLSYYRTSIFYSPFGGLVTGILGFLLLSFHIVIEKKMILPNIKTKILMFLGVLSYGFYSWHGLLLLHKKSLSNNFIFLFFLSLLFSYLSYIFIERFFLNLKKEKRLANQKLTLQPNESH